MLMFREDAPSTTGSASASAQRALAPLVLVVSLFFLWGVANNLNDILIRQFKKAFSLSDFESGLVQSAFYLGYFLLAVPAGVFMRRFGYKNTVILGLAAYASGAFLFYPAAEARTYELFLLALFVIAGGLAFLETSANPLMTMLGPASGAERRLNFAQAFNSLGAISGILIGRFFILSGREHAPEELAAMSEAARAAYYASESSAVQAPYLVIGMIVTLWALLVLMARFPVLVEHAQPSSHHVGRARNLDRKRQLALAVAAQFFYVGAQVGVWSYLIRYAQVAVPGTPEKTAADYLMISLVLFMIGRFGGAALMQRWSPSLMLAACGAINAVLMAVASALPGWLGLGALIASSFFMSIMFPTIFALGIRGLGKHTKVASSLLVMSIIGGAALTAAMGALSDASGIHVAMLVPFVCFLVVFGFALFAHQSE